MKFFFVDETGTDQESKILAIACVITNHYENLRDKIEKLKQSLLKDKQYKDIPSVKKLKNKSFHYCEDSEIIKDKVIALISDLRFECYICYDYKKYDFCASEGFDWYDKLFCKLMYDRLRNRKNKNEKVSICFEQHDNSVEKRRQKLESEIHRLVQEIESKDRCKFMSLPTVQSAGKEEPCLAIADYIAAIFKDYEEAIYQAGKVPRHSNTASRQTRNFNMIRPKLRVIHNYGTGEFWTRKKLEDF